MPNIPGVSSLDSNRGAKRAREARRALELDPLCPLPCLLTVVEERTKHAVVIRAMPADIAGACFSAGERAVLHVNGRQVKSRQRFTLAHELGHAWCGHDAGVSVDTVETLSGSTSDRYEIQANAFAAEFLVPRRAVERLVTGNPSLDEVVTIASAYGVSAIVVVFRCLTAGCASATHAERLKDEIHAGYHDDAARRLGLQPLDDRLRAIDDLPYLSASLASSALASALQGRASVPAAAEAAGCDTTILQAAVENLVRR